VVTDLGTQGARLLMAPMVSCDGTPGGYRRRNGPRRLDWRGGEGEDVLRPPRPPCVLEGRGTPGGAPRGHDVLEAAQLPLDAAGVRLGARGVIPLAALPAVDTSVVRAWVTAVTAQVSRLRSDPRRLRGRARERR
jgi:hypothetical protein